MTREFSASRLDVKAFALAKGQLAGHDSLLKYKRLAEVAHKLHPELYVDWQAGGEMRERLGATAQVWLHLQAQAQLPQVCQRCMQAMEVPLAVDRWFRFVLDEATAEVQDADSEEDLLVLSREFSLHGLIEDELLLDLPLVPRHEDCPVAVKMSAGEEELEREMAEEPPQVRNPFAALADFRLHDGKKTP